MVTTQKDLAQEGFETALRMFNHGSMQMINTMVLWQPKAFERFAAAFDSDGNLDPQWLEQANAACQNLNLPIRLRPCPGEDIPTRWVDDPTVLVLQTTRTDERYGSTATFGIHRDGHIEAVPVAFFM